MFATLPKQLISKNKVFYFTVAIVLKKAKSFFTSVFLCNTNFFKLLTQPGKFTEKVPISKNVYNLPFTGRNELTAKLPNRILHLRRNTAG